ncbi:hypothetical protein RO3G_04665 [Rhizopus delemar RA 99-880]|uniref:Uncharacterized protein n=1 Tax=Rhizopus delemar (strain RA 99-880 / ATCC MYA-4621 / FGSC 9543 / NRRL 43880) TaxID=246409 RepID=I1BUT0_RHIO9|nr:hypothetical protein RO3G_04665 [Rhizopus delemar RA 99-880]|eukprot:EIE79960.1 hypothetical protein RO3G_04665 [Rhizopus delemar RA 99-880]
MPAGCPTQFPFTYHNTTSSDDVVDNDVNINVDLDIDMESKSSVSIESVASSLNGNKRIQVVNPDHH